MGETRKKKPSNRTLKAKQRIEGASCADGESRGPSVGPVGTSIEATPTTHTNNHLTPTTLSSKTSHTSLLSSGSTNSWQGNHNPRTYDPLCVEVRLTDNKGYALFAASTIPSGSIVLAEIPVIRLTTMDESRKLDAEHILLEKFNDLSRNFQKAFKKLHDTNKNGFSRLRSIYHSNCYNLDGARSIHGGSCVGLKASRINHSCIPNVQLSFEETIPENLLGDIVDSAEGTQDRLGGIMIFRALRKITKGKEIVSNYETIYATRSQRQFELQIHYGFRCDCDACIRTMKYSERDDDRRLEMMRLRKQLDAVDKRLVVLDNEVGSGLNGNQYYLKQKRAKHSFSSGTHELVPLSVDCCQEMIKALEKLGSLLDEVGVLGSEQQRVRQEKEIWVERVNTRV